MYPDETLMMAVKQGDLKKLSPLFDRYQVKIYNYFLHQQVGQAISEDLTQNTFERILKYRKSFKEDSNFKAWIYRIATNVKHDYYRGMKIKIDDREEIPTTEQTITEPFKETAQEMQENALKKAIAQLTLEQQKLIWLTRFEGMKYADVADLLGYSLSNVKTKIHRAIKELKVEYFKIYDHELGQ